jgi:hypothetical protein
VGLLSVSLPSARDFPAIVEIFRLAFSPPPSLLHALHDATHPRLSPRATCRWGRSAVHGEPQFGDDFTYWSFGFNTHEHGFSSIPKGGFHLLRWPVWGLCWLAQGIFGYGLVSYYFAPFLVLVLGAWCAFAMGWHFFQKAGPAWACGVIFLFHPLLDANLTRPYPDIGEG